MHQFFSLFIFKPLGQKGEDSAWHYSISLLSIHFTAQTKLNCHSSMRHQNYCFSFVKKSVFLPCVAIGGCLCNQLRHCFWMNKKRMSEAPGIRFSMVKIIDLCKGECNVRESRKGRRLGNYCWEHPGTVKVLTYFTKKKKKKTWKNLTKRSEVTENNIIYILFF